MVRDVPALIRQYLIKHWIALHCLIGFEDIWWSTAAAGAAGVHGVHDEAATTGWSVTESPANFHFNQSQPFLKSFSCNFLSIFPANFHLNQSQPFLKSFSCKCLSIFPANFHLHQSLQFIFLPPLKLPVNGNFRSLGSLKYSAHLEEFDFFFLKKFPFS